MTLPVVTPEEQYKRYWQSFFWKLSIWGGLAFFIALGLLLYFGVTRPIIEACGR